MRYASWCCVECNATGPWDLSLSVRCGSGLSSIWWKRWRITWRTSVRAIASTLGIIWTTWCCGCGWPRCGRAQLTWCWSWSGVDFSCSIADGVQFDCAWLLLLSQGRQDPRSRLLGCRQTCALSDLCGCASLCGIAQLGMFSSFRVAQLGMFCWVCFAELHSSRCPHGCVSFVAPSLRRSTSAGTAASLSWNPTWMTSRDATARNAFRNQRGTDRRYDSCSRHGGYRWCCEAGGERMGRWVNQIPFQVKISVVHALQWCLWRCSTRDVSSLSHKG